MCIRDSDRCLAALVQTEEVDQISILYQHSANVTRKAGITLPLSRNEPKTRPDELKPVHGQSAIDVDDLSGSVRHIAARHGGGKLADIFGQSPAFLDQ